MGHTPADVWSYTPRQVSAFLEFAESRRKREAARDLSIGTMAARGNPKDVKKAIKEWQKP